ncbi:hypothetical protein TRIUR3_17584 [Triticum urartu]|uniref:Uncharacterized protein n=1 Tax=Triticum urartu TaxID=4572 RepID=M7ZBT7_TRIUA|nr:hypothetical protein TRIUR3_17584 [Triticum urartu]
MEMTSSTMVKPVPHPLVGEKVPLTIFDRAAVDDARVTCGGAGERGAQGRPSQGRGAVPAPGGAPRRRPAPPGVSSAFSTSTMRACTSRKWVFCPGW